MADTVPDLLEIRHAYGDGTSVLKRGLEATPLVVRKHALAEDEVITFSSWRGGRKALTVFHFHPAFPPAEREAYMRDHEEGHALLAEYLAEREDERRNRWRQVRTAAKRAGTTLHALAAAAVVSTLHGPMR